MKIVLIAPSGAIASAFEQLGASAESDTVLAVSRTTPDMQVPSVVITPAMRGMTDRVESVLGRSVLGRNIQRLSPFDAGRRFAGAALKNSVLREHVIAADLIVVLERDGILTGWRAAKKWARDQARAVYGVPPAQAILAQSREN